MKGIALGALSSVFEARYPGMEHINLSTSMGTPKAVMLEQFQRVGEEIMPAFKR